MALADEWLRSPAHAVRWTIANFALKAADRMERIGTVETKTRVRVFDEGNFRGSPKYLSESELGVRPAPALGVP